MTTVINSPRDDSSGVGVMFGVIAGIIVLGFIFWYVAPMLRSTTVIVTPTPTPAPVTNSTTTINLLGQ
jgi:hypothetical protein